MRSPLGRILRSRLPIDGMNAMVRKSSAWVSMSVLWDLVAPGPTPDQAVC
jgi:hypothetical protein